MFAEKSFATVILLLMFLPALPLPTGGITHIFELIVMLLSLELMIGRRTIWLPQRWLDKELGLRTRKKMLPLVMRRLRWFERFSRPRLGAAINHRLSLRFIGLLFFLSAFFAFIAPPFAGLDTLPSLGAVVIALSLILEDVVVLVIGCLLAAVGIGLVIGTAGLTLQFVNRII